MANVTAIQEAKNWIYDVLSADSALTAIVSTRIYADRVPSPGTFPYVLFNTMAATDIQAVGTVREATSALFQVRVVTYGSPDANARKADYRIDTVLGYAKNLLSGDFYFTSWRMDAVDRPEYDQLQQKQYHNLGGIYRVWITPA